MTNSQSRAGFLPIGRIGHSCSCSVLPRHQDAGALMHVEYLRQWPFKLSSSCTMQRIKQVILCRKAGETAVLQSCLSILLIQYPATSGHAVSTPSCESTLSNPAKTSGFPCTSCGVNPSSRQYAASKPAASPIFHSTGCSR